MFSLQKTAEPDSPPHPPLSACNVNLRGAKLKGVDLGGADLRGANLSSADLREAYLGDADLTDADLSHARLEDAFLAQTVMQGAVLDWALMDRSRLLETNISGARLYMVSLHGAIYMPIAGPPKHAAELEGLSTVTFGNETGIAQLRQFFQESGQRDLEREATYAIERARTESIGAVQWWRHPLAALEALLRRIAFEWTVAYGLRPGRALLIILALLCLFTPAYGWAIWRNRWRSKAALYKILPVGRLDISRPMVRQSTSDEVSRLSLPLWPALMMGAYFSLLSAFHVGYRDLSIGHWISRLQPHKFSLEPVGWVRTLSGIQSLLSLYLLVMWFLSYFGRPFQ